MGADGNRSVRRSEWQSNELGDSCPLNAANSGAVDERRSSDCPRLAWLIEVWPMFSEAPRDAIAKLVVAEINDVMALADEAGSL